MNHCATRMSALLLCLTAGCVQGPDYEKPTVEVPSTYRFSDQAYLLTSSTDSHAWWNGLNDPVLDGLIRECLANNRDLRIATARVDEFAAILAGTKSQGLPQVGYGLSGNRTRTSEEKLPALIYPHSTTWSSVLSASWEIDL